MPANLILAAALGYCSSTSVVEQAFCVGVHLERGCYSTVIATHLRMGPGLTGIPAAAAAIVALSRVRPC